MTHRRDSFRPPRLRPSPRLVLTLALFLFTAACATLPTRPAGGPDDGAAAAPPNYALVIDASSSGSRIHIFEWREGAGGDLPWIEAAPSTRQAGEAGWQLVVDGGLSDYADRPEEAGESLDPLRAFARDKLAAAGADLAATPLYLKATAGMRLVPEPDRSAIMADVRQALESWPFDFERAEIISGQQEGLYGWVSVNYLLGLLGRGAFPTVGALDLGGASTQVTFLPIDFPESEGVAFELGGTNYYVYSHSYLGFGQDQARQAVASPACYPSGYPIPDGTEGFAAEAVGTGDYDACRAAIRAFLERPCGAGRCSLMGVYQPPLYGDFFAFSGYGYASAFFGLDLELSLPELERRTAEYCATDWRQILRDRPDPAGRKYLSGYCFNGAYVASLLTDGFGFAPDTRRIATPRAVQGADVGWVLGSFLFELAGSVD